MARSLIYIEVLIKLLSRSLPRLISTVATEASRSMLYNTPIRLCATAHNNRDILNVYNIVVNFFFYKIVNNINILNTSIKLSILYKNNYVLIITKNNYSFRVRVVRFKELIKELL